MKYRKVNFIIVKIVLITILVLNFPIMVKANYSSYNANEWEVFKNRTKEQIGAEYAKAINGGTTYRNGNSDTYYNSTPSLKSPYLEGELTNDTLESMTAMSNYYRWLEGASPINLATSTSDLQAGALVRNWQFAHDIDISKKPTDMSDELWNRGAQVSHNILARGFSPRGSITGWLDEGYNLVNGTWDTIGHRIAILSSSVGNLSYGYAGSIAIGKVGKYTNEISLPYTAFPVPGYMPSNVISSQKSAWHIELNRDIVEINDINQIKVIVTNLKTNKSYDCTVENNKLQKGYIFGATTISFVQPESENRKNYSNGEKFKVEVTGLTEKSTNNEINLTYTTEFFDVSNYATSTRAISAQMSGNWNNLILSSENATTDNLKKISYILPTTVNVKTEAGRIATVRTESDWILDETNKCWTATIDKNSFPSFLIDPDGILNSVKITYNIDDGYRNYYFHASNNKPAIGEAMNFNLWTYMSTSNNYEVYQISNLNGILVVGQRFKKDNSTIYKNPSTNWYEFKLNPVKDTDTGTYFCIYYHDSEYYNNAYLAGITDIEVTLPKATFTKEPQSKNSVYNGQYQELAIAGKTNDGTIKYSLNGRDFDVKIPTGKNAKSYKVYYKIVGDSNHLDSNVKSFTSTISQATSNNDNTSTGTEKPNTPSGNGNTAPTNPVNPSGTGTTTKPNDTGTTTTSKPNTSSSSNTSIGPTKPNTSAKPSGTSTTTTTLTFRDVKKSDWFYNAVYYTYTNKIISGYNTTTFAPNDKLTRGMLVTILHRMEGSPKVSGKTKFPDVQNSKDYYYNAVKWATDNKIVSGYGSGKFGPNDNITREDLAVILYKYARYKEKNTSQTNNLSAFTDKNQVSSYATSQVKWAVGAGVVSGNADKTLKPKGYTTRAEASAMLENYCKKVGR